MAGNVAVYVFGVLVLLIALLDWRRSSKLRREVKFAIESADAVRRHVNASYDEVKREIADLRRVVYKRTATGQFHRDMTVAEALELHPDAAAVMASFHLGGCSSCSISGHHLLGPAAESYNVDVDALLGALNSLLDGGAIPKPQPRGAELLSIDISA